MGSSISMHNEQVIDQPADWNNAQAIAVPPQTVELSHTKQIILVSVIAVSALVFISGVVATIQNQREKAYFNKLQTESRIVVL